MEKMNGKLKFKKEPTKFRDTFLFVLIFLLCAATVVTIQIKSKRDSSAADAVSETQSTEQNTDDSFAIDAPSAESAETSAAMSDNIVFGNGSDHTAQEKQNVQTDNAAETAAAITPGTETPVAEVPKAMNFSAPCDGKVIKKFSDSELIYSKTMDDWRIHLGVDIDAPIGAKITACENGIVEEVKNDPEYGNTVVIRHNNILTKYSNLASEKLPTVGDNIGKGDVIGVVGDSASSEILDESHIHFAMCEDNIYIDPNKYIKFELTE